VTRFLIDAQLSRKLASLLRERDHDALHVFDRLDPQADDRAIAALANALGASVITKDADFAQLARRGVLEQPLVWLRFPNLSNQHLLERVDQALPDIVSAIAARDSIIEID
jgi:predicted nuclease of predicted toxin-antitoxin system